jgi:tRNA(Ile)-lysidine synthase
MREGKKACRAPGETSFTMTIIESLIENLEAEGLLKSAPRTHVVLAYSGGADSTALLYLLHELKQKYPLDVTAAYFNHRWRGNPPAELPLVHQNCIKTQTPLVIVQADLTLPKTEAAARQARYRQLTKLAQNLHANALLTAHHADDQIETLLFRILRGTGLDGLAGIQKRLILRPHEGAPVPILRPLLDLARKTVMEYLRSHHLSYFEDPTNTDVRIQRNRIRNEIFPQLERVFPQVKNALFRLSLVSEGDLQILEDAVDAVWSQVHHADKHGVYLDAIRFNQLSLPYQRRILKRFLAQHHIFADFQTIEDILEFIQGEDRHNLAASLKSIPKGEDGKTRFLSLYKNCLRLIDGPKAPPTKESIPVAVPGVNTMPDIQRTFKALPWQAPEKIKVIPIRPNDTQQVFVDLSAFLDKPLELRTRRPGDKFHPIGMSTPLRVKKFLINRGIPRFERDQLLMLAHGKQILWIPGLGISQEIMVKQNLPPTHLLKLVPGLHPEEELLCPPIREDLPDLDEETPEATKDLAEALPEDIIDSLELEADDETESLSSEALETDHSTGAVSP